jgi:hypothetical protein
MMFQDQPRLRRLILIGTPLFTGILLLFHPLPDPAEAEQLGRMDMYALFAPVADRFLVVHVLFAPALALLGLSVILLLNGVRGIAARISRVSAFVFVVTYSMYETIVGTGTGILVRSAAALPPDEQVVIVDAVIRNFEDPIFGDFSVLTGVASLSWLLTVTLAALALRRSGKPLIPCILLGLSFILIFHPPPLGPIGMLLFLLAVVAMERAGSPEVTSEENETRATSYSTNIAKPG